jgi:peptide/nickel transport system substrate-binding protein
MKRIPTIDRVTRRRVLEGGLAAPFVLSSGAAAQTGQRPRLRIAVADLPPTLEPARELSNVGTRVVYSIYDTLLRRDFLGATDGGGSTLKPHLATEWERRSSRELVVALREGVRFHNGDTLTAEDVTFTFRQGRMWGDAPQFPEARAFFGVLDAVEALGPYKVLFRTRQPDVLLEHRLASWASQIINRRAYEELGPTRFALAPVGTGPYLVRRFKFGERLELDAFDAYWMGRPTAREVVFQLVPEVASRAAGLAAGEFDLVTNVPPDQVGEFERMRHAEPRSVVLANSHLITFDERGSAMGDKRVRQALSLAIDRRLLVDTLWHGRAVVPPGHNYPEYGDMFLPGRALRYDPEAARQLLKETGYSGERITYRTLPNYYTNALRVAQIAIEMWKAVGINASLQVVENFSQMQAAGQQIGNTSNSTRFPDPLGALWPSWGPDSGPQRRGEWTTTKAFNEAGRALEIETDLARRRALFGRMLDAWEDECPATIIYQPLESYGVRKNVNWRPYTFYFMDLRPDNLSFAS